MTTLGIITAWTIGSAFAAIVLGRMCALGGSSDVRVEDLRRWRRADGDAEQNHRGQAAFHNFGGTHGRP